ncbi:MAG: winged helix DNA-binding domain-containing protein [Micromonosporaceae bacterium]
MQMLDRRRLNRALLDRQLLLRRAELPVTDAVARLAGMQAQVPQAPYLGLWSRLAGFTPDRLSDLIADRRLVRAVVMRGTIHLLTVDDYVEFWPLARPVMERDVTGNTTYGQHRVAGLDLDAVLATGRRLVEQAPRTAVELRELLAPHWPDRRPPALAYAVRQLLPLVQVPPRGLWRGTGQPRFTTIEAWAGRGVAAAPSVDAMVLRYLAGFGPASVADVQTWSGLTRLREVVERLQLRTYRSEDAATLYDHPDAPVPDPDTPAPVRFLPEFDNTFFSHADRSRVMADAGYVRRAYNRGMFLVDGFLRGAWKLQRGRGVATLTLETFEPLTGGRAAEVEAEAARVAEFLAGDVPRREIAGLTTGQATL